MKLLLDTHLLLWAAGEPAKLPKAARAQIEDVANVLLYSAASMWEIVIKRRLGRADFQVDVRRLRRGLMDNGYLELPILSLHAITMDTLPVLHKDPFDRILIAQAKTEGVALLTVDRNLASYGEPVQVV
jgi:PIN domain nuclease of toxin-antitoxin system